MRPQLTGTRAPVRVHVLARAPAELELGDVESHSSYERLCYAPPCRPCFNRRVAEPRGDGRSRRWEGVIYSPLLPVAGGVHEARRHEATGCRQISMERRRSSSGRRQDVATREAVKSSSTHPSGGSMLGRQRGDVGHRGDPILRPTTTPPFPRPRRMQRWRVLPRWRMEMLPRGSLTMIPSQVFFDVTSSRSALAGPGNQRSTIRTPEVIHHPH